MEDKSIKKNSVINIDQLIKKFGTVEKALREKIEKESDKISNEYRRQSLREIRRNLVIAESWKKQYPEEENAPRRIFSSPLKTIPITKLKNQGVCHQKCLEPIVNILPVSSEIQKDLVFSSDKYHGTLKKEEDRIIWGNYDYGDPTCYCEGYYNDQYDHDTNSHSGLFISASVPKGGIWSQTEVDLSFLSNIDITDEGLYSLSISSEAAVYTGNSRAGWDEWYFRDYIPKDPIIAVRFTVSHDVQVIWRHPILTDETISEPQYLPGGSLWQFIEEPFPESISDTPSRFFMGVEDPAIMSDCCWIPFIGFGAALTKCDEKSPRIDYFRGPCTLQVIDTIRYKFNILSSQMGKGSWIVVTGGVLYPLKWYLYEVEFKKEIRLAKPSIEWLINRIPKADD